MTPPIRLFLIDDHTLLRRGLVALLSQHADLCVVGEAGDAGQALRQLPQLQPDVILLDNHLPGVRGIDAIAGLREASPASRVVMLTVSEDSDDLATALRHGAQGYLLKTIDGDLLAEAVRRAARGEPVVSPEMMGKLVAAFQSQGAPEPAPLPPRTRDGAALAPVAARRGRAARNRTRGQQQGNCPHAGHCRNHGEDPCAAHPAQARPELAGAGGGVRLRPAAWRCRISY